MSAPNVSILIVAYRSREVIDGCLQSLPQAAARTNHEVLLIDNGDDGTGGLVAETYPKVRVVPSRGNVGFGTANNILSHSARGDYVLFLNPDTIAEPGAVDALVDFARDRQEASAWGGTILSPEGRPDVSNHLTLPSLRRLASAAMGMERLHSGTSSEGFSRERRVGALCGAFFMMRRKTFEDMGGFDPTFFLYSEELDLFTRLAKKGGHSLATPDARIRHLIGTTGTMTAQRMLYKSAGAMHYARKHWSRPKAWLAGVLIWIAAFERALVGALVRDRTSRLAVMGRTSWAICARPGFWWHGYARGRPRNA
ncbi:MAG: glycosyltransferase family 2 protein [Alteraurantiacibacter sp.]